MGAVFIQRGAQIDHVPTSDVDAGSFVVIGTLVGVAEREIKSGELGAISVSGVYRAEKDDEAITAGAKVYLDADKKVTASAGTTPANVAVGVALEAAGADDTTVLVLLK